MEQTDKLMTPRYLYKILSIENWEKSKERGSLLLSSADDDFIHFSTEETLERIIAKYWKEVPGYAVLKIDTIQLPGKMVYEANPGGSTKYYHLYNGSIPRDSVVDYQLFPS